MRFYQGSIVHLVMIFKMCKRVPTTLSPTSAYPAKITKNLEVKTVFALVLVLTSGFLVV